MQKAFLLCCVLVLLALLPRSASAHANLVESNPAANSVIAQAQATARLRFSEPLDPSYSRVVLSSAESGSVGTDPSRVAPDDPYVLLLDLPALSEGVYALQWCTLSTVDGHTMQGAVSFAVGDPAAANAPLLLPPPPPDPLSTPAPVDVALRWLTALSLVLAVGSLIFSLTVWRSELVPDADVYESLSDALRRLAFGAALAGIIVAGGTLLRASTTAESSLLFTITGSRIGLVLMARLLLAAALAGLLRTAGTARSRWALLVGLGGLLTISLLSHSAVSQTAGTTSLSALATAAAVTFDFVHLVATAAWIGSLPALMLVLLALRKRGGKLHGALVTLLVARYSSLATAAIIALAATGTIAALRHIVGIGELWTTTYGRALSIKLLLFGALLLIGGYNRWWLKTESVTSSTLSRAGLRQLRVNVGLEVALSVVLLLAVGVLTASPPTRDAAQTGSDFAETVAVRDVALSLQVARDDLAGDIFAVTARGLPTDVQPEVVIRVSMPAHQMGEQELELREVEPGRWGARAPLLTMPGPRQVETIVRAIGMNDVRHTFIVDTTPTSAPSTAAFTLPVWALILVLAFLGVALSQLPLGNTWQHRFQLGSVVMLLGAFMAAVSPYYFTRATEPSNPLSATPEVLAAGQAVYQRSCVTCHGVGGKGDGPAAQSLPGLPADFTQPHFATHTDAEVYGWIKGGKPGTAMPAFGEQLSEEQIWQTITYIRQFYLDAQQAAR